MHKCRVGLLISGRGSNMAALIEACRHEDFPARIVAVVSNEPQAAGLAYAAAHNIKTHAISHRDYHNREAYDHALNDYLSAQALDYIACAGFMRILGAAMIMPWYNRLLNIHPSLLPLYKGLHTHERALAAGDKQHGCSVHMIRPGLDDGPIIAQASLDIQPHDTAETLSARVLKLEHRLYPCALAGLIDGRIRLDDDQVTNPILDCTMIADQAAQPDQQ